MVSEKFNRLRELLRGYGSCLVAYSGGVDSVFLARVAHEVLGEKSLAVIADSPSLPRRELEEALAMAGASSRFRCASFGRRNSRTRITWPIRPNRCYFCKHELFTELAPLARAGGLR